MILLWFEVLLRRGPGGTATVQVDSTITGVARRHDSRYALDSAGLIRLLGSTASEDQCIPTTSSFLGAVLPDNARRFRQQNSARTSRSSKKGARSAASVSIPARCRARHFVKQCSICRVCGSACCTG